MRTFGFLPLASVDSELVPAILASHANIDGQLCTLWTRSDISGDIIQPPLMAIPGVDPHLTLDYWNHLYNQLTQSPSRPTPITDEATASLLSSFAGGVLTTLIHTDVPAILTTSNVDDILATLEIFLLVRTDVEQANAEYLYEFESLLRSALTEAGFTPMESLTGRRRRKISPAAYLIGRCLALLDSRDYDELSAARDECRELFRVWRTQQPAPQPIG